MKKEFSAEIAAKAKGARNVKEFLEIAKENGYVLSASEAEAYFAKLNSSCEELSDEDIDSVSGGFAVFQQPLDGGVSSPVTRTMSVKPVGGISTMANTDITGAKTMANAHAGDISTMAFIPKDVDDSNLISGPGNSM